MVTILQYQHNNNIQCTEGTDPSPFQMCQHSFQIIYFMAPAMWRGEYENAIGLMPTF